MNTLTAWFAAKWAGLRICPEPGCGHDKAAHGRYGCLCAHVRDGEHTSWCACDRTYGRSSL